MCSTIAELYAKHVCIFADGERLAHDGALGRRIGPDTKLYVMQALSGG